jgi:hypothetical protein
MQTAPTDIIEQLYRFLHRLAGEPNAFARRGGDVGCPIEVGEGERGGRQACREFADIRMQRAIDHVGKVRRRKRIAFDNLRSSSRHFAIGVRHGGRFLHFRHCAAVRMRLNFANRCNEITTRHGNITFDAPACPAGRSAPFDIGAPFIILKVATLTGIKADADERIAIHIFEKGLAGVMRPDDVAALIRARAYRPIYPE